MSRLPASTNCRGHPWAAPSHSTPDANWTHWTRRRLARTAAAVGSGLVPGALAAACATPGSTPAAPVKVTEPATLLYWTVTGGADGARMHALAEQYTRETPQVTIEDVQGPPDFLTKFVSSVVAGSPPDVVLIRMTYIAGFADRSALLDLQPRELQQAALRAEDFDPTVWRASEYKGKHYTIPLDIHGYHFLVNATAVQQGGLDPAKPPATWNDWREWTTRLTQGDRYGTFIFAAGGALMWQFQHHLKQAAKVSGQMADLFSADGTKAAFNNGSGLEALSLLADIYRRARLPIPQNQLDMFEQRTLASLLIGSWALNRFADPASPAFNDLRVSYAPQRDVGKPSWWAQSHQIAIPRPQKVDERKRVAAYNFAHWLVEHSLEWAKAGQIPASRRVVTSEAFQKAADPVYRHLGFWVKNLPTAQFMQLHPKFVDVENQLPPILNRAVRGEITPQSSLVEGEQLVNAILAS